ncbi:hypothetical protein ACHAXA_002179 [Cyclostephanos tholiformis]|uniref:Uncharacterized protein n=1 Tax=Cyclostephanos tholiformis TaxID=382380 RepID=A0ABD3RVJ9_9STRA
MEALGRALRSFHERHERIKHTIHTYAMGCFYFSIPVVGGWYVMQWAISRSVNEIGERGEKLRIKSLDGHVGDRTIINGRAEKIGAGGKYGGVHLAVSDPITQENNMAMLEAMFRKERRKRRRRDGEEGKRRGEDDDDDSKEELR